MSEQGTLRKPLLLASTGIITVSLLYFAYNSYKTQSSSQSPAAQANSLHRSNAIRRPRRRWRRGHVPQELNSDPTIQAIQNLHGRIAARRPYGRYENRELFGDIARSSLEQGLFDLIPPNLGPMYLHLTSLRTFTELEAQVLNHHVEGIFIQNFLIEEFPPGYIIGDDVESIVHAMHGHGIREDVVRIMVSRFDEGKPLTPVNWDMSDDVRTVQEATQEDSSPDNSGHAVTPHDAIERLRGPSDEDTNGHGWGDDDDSDAGGSQGMLDLLYHIAGEQAKRNGLVHRGVECNSCGDMPIRGIRYHCVNCFDYDLCESCEAQQVHHKTHIFYKIRIPIPSRGQIKQVSPVWYPGNPNAFFSSLPKALSKYLEEKFRTEKTELESLYEMYKCLAGHSIPRESDPARLGMAINRKNFDVYFTTTSDDRAPPQNLLYDRIFAFYDQNNDDLITFDEFVGGLSNLRNRTRAARVERMFKIYDMDGDGYVDRKDFLRIFRAYYAWHKEFNRELIANHDELDEDIRDAIQGSQPISAAFGWNDFAAHISRAGQDKQPNGNGDLHIASGPNGVLQNESDLRGDRARAIGTAALRGQTRLYGNRTFRSEPEADQPALDLSFTYDYSPPNIAHFDDVGSDVTLSSTIPEHVYGWPPLSSVRRSDIVNALGTDVAVDEITDPIDRARVVYAQARRIDQDDEERRVEYRQDAVNQRWRRRHFYLDEQEGLTRPPGYTEPDSSDDEDANIEEIDDAPPLQTSPDSRRQSLRSRSSSKVRFDDSAIDTDYETRSNTSSRSVPLNERWGGWELSEPEKDIGKEILYQAVQQGFNELLDPLFKQKEDEDLKAIESRRYREKWKAELDEYERSLLEGALRPEDVLPKEQETVGNEVLVNDSQTAAEGHGQDQQSTAGGGTEQLVDQTGNIVDQHGETSLERDYRDPTLPQNRPNEPEVSELLLRTNTQSKSKASSPSEYVKHTRQSEPEARPTLIKLQTMLLHRAIDTEAEARGGYGKLSFKEFKRKLAEESNIIPPAYSEPIPTIDGIVQLAVEGSDDSEGGDSGDQPPAVPTGSHERTNRPSRRSAQLNTRTTEDGEIEYNQARAAVNAASTSSADNYYVVNRHVGNNDHGNNDDDVDDNDNDHEEIWASTADLGRYTFLGSWLEMAQF